MISWIDVRQLLAFKNGDFWVSTLHLNVDGRRFPKRQEYMVVFKNLIKGAEDGIKSLEISKEAQESIKEDLLKMETYLRNQFQRNHHRVIIIFSCSGRNLWHTLSFPIPLRSNLVIHPHPYTRPLTALLDQYERYCTVLISSEQARLFGVYLGEIQEHSEIFKELPGKIRAGQVHVASGKEYKSLAEYGLAEKRIQRRARKRAKKAGSMISGGEYGLAETKIERHIEDHVKRHLKRVSNLTFSFFQNQSFDHLILGGQEGILAEFEPMLHSYLKPRLVGKIKADPKFPLSAVYEQTQELIRQVEWEKKDRMIREITETSQQGGLGVLGLTQTFEALRQRAVHTLVIQGDVQWVGARCPSCDRLTVKTGYCPRCDVVLEATTDLTEEAIEQAILQGSKVYHTAHHPILDVREGIAAKLRFPLSEKAGKSAKEAA